MFALSIRQPEALLIALGHVKLHGRTWATGVRGPVAIHAAARMSEQDQKLVRHNMIGRAFAKAGFDPTALPLGGFIGVAQLAACAPTGKAFETPPWPMSMFDLLVNDFAQQSDGHLLRFDGARVLPFTPAPGMPGLWKLDPSQVSLTSFEGISVTSPRRVWRPLGVGAMTNAT